MDDSSPGRSDDASKRLIHRRVRSVLREREVLEPAARRIVAADTGIGIGSDVRKNIFQPFMQADTSHARHYGGAGLGLAIVARLLEAMNGAVEVKSEPGSGSMFMFRIPLTRSAAGEVPPWKSWEHALAGRLVAIVEPAEMARATIADILRGRGMFASSFAAADQVPSGRFACAVTSDPGVGVHPQVVITSPLDQKQYAVQVSWPVAERELIDAVGEALGLGAPMAVAPKDTTLHAMTSLRILLVEDNDVNREVFTDMLHRHGHNVTVASDASPRWPSSPTPRSTPCSWMCSFPASTAWR